MVGKQKRISFSEYDMEHLYSLINFEDSCIECQELKGRIKKFLKIKQMKCIKCNSEKIISIEYCDPTEETIPFEHQYDGISEYRCKDCGARWGRWSGRELKGDDYERVFGKNI
jgi:uncharacterized protein with PIN domain